MFVCGLMVVVLWLNWFMVFNGLGLIKFLLFVGILKI